MNGCVYVNGCVKVNWDMGEVCVNMTVCVCLCVCVCVCTCVYVCVHVCPIVLLYAKVQSLCTLYAVPGYTNHHCANVRMC